MQVKTIKYLLVFMFAGFLSLSAYANCPDLSQKGYPDPTQSGWDARPGEPDFSSQVYSLIRTQYFFSPPNIGFFCDYNGISLTIYVNKPFSYEPSGGSWSCKELSANKKACICLSSHVTECPFNLP